MWLNLCLRRWRAGALAINSPVGYLRRRALRRGQGSESRADFVHKLQTALKELRESNNWLRLLVKAGKIPPDRLSGLVDESNQLRAMLSRAVGTTKEREKAET
jgi:hypothetical protein